MKYRRVVCEVDAIPWHPEYVLTGVTNTAPKRGSVRPRALVDTRRGKMIVHEGAFIVTDLKTGARWAVEAEAFHCLYEPVPEEPK